MKETKISLWREVDGNCRYFYEIDNTYYPFCSPLTEEELGMFLSSLSDLLKYTWDELPGVSFIDTITIPHEPQSDVVELNVPIFSYQEYERVLDNMLVTLGKTLKDFNSVADAIQAIVDFEVGVALDPSVSELAQGLQEDAKALGYCEGRKDALQQVIIDLQSHVKDVDCVLGIVDRSVL